MQTLSLFHKHLNIHLAGVVRVDGHQALEMQEKMQPLPVGLYVQETGETHVTLGLGRGRLGSPRFKMGRILFPEKPKVESDQESKGRV